MLPPLRTLLAGAADRLTGGTARPGEAPLVRARLPFLGHAVEFGRDLDVLLRACQREHGDVFTLLVAGRRMTFFLDPFSFPLVLKAQDDLTFHEIGDEFGRRAFGYEPLRPGPDSDALHDAYAAHLKNAELAALTARMESRLRAALDRFAAAEPRDELLFDFIARCIFAAGNETLFGDGAADDDALRDFQRLDRWFPLLAAGVPRRLLREAASGLAGLVARCDVARSNASPFIRAREAILDRATTRRNRNHFQAGLLWAAQANTVPAAFWALAQILRDPAARAAVTAEVRACGVADLKRLVRTQSCVNEALRLSSSGLTLRLVKRPHVLELEPGRTIALRAGDRVALCPSIMHRDPEIFADPDVYRFDRFLAHGAPRQFTKGGRRVPIPLMPYGGGVSMCPGRFLANNEIVQLVALALTHLDIELRARDLPARDLRRAGLGVLPPVHDIPCRIGRRAST